MDSGDAEIGAQLRVYRERAGLTQAELARRLSERGISGMYPQTITKIEAGSRSLKYREGLAVASVLGVRPEQLVAGTAGLMERLVSALQGIEGSRVDAVGSLVMLRDWQEELRVSLDLMAAADVAVPDDLTSSVIGALLWSPGYLLTKLPEQYAAMIRADGMPIGDSWGSGLDGEHPEA